MDRRFDNPQPPRWSNSGEGRAASFLRHPHEIAVVKAQYETAWADIVSGLTQWEVWSRLGWQEVKRRYRRTVLGPFWATLSIGMFIGGMAWIWAPLFKTDVSSYLPFLAAGLVTWAFTTAMITEGCATYTAGSGVIQQLIFPFSTLRSTDVRWAITVDCHNAEAITALVNL